MQKIKTKSFKVFTLFSSRIICIVHTHSKHIHVSIHVNTLLPDVIATATAASATATKQAKLNYPLFAARTKSVRFLFSDINSACTKCTETGMAHTTCRKHICVQDGRHNNTNQTEQPYGYGYTIHPHKRTIHNCSVQMHAYIAKYGTLFSCYSTNPFILPSLHAFNTTRNHQLKKKEKKKKARHSPISIHMPTDMAIVLCVRASLWRAHWLEWLVGSACILCIYGFSHLASSSWFSVYCCFSTCRDVR